MSRYFCLCGDKFKNKKYSDLHMKMYEDLEIKEGFTRHKIFKKHFKFIFIKSFFGYSSLKIMRLVGAFMIYCVVIRHFHIDFSLWEATAIGIGLGLYID